MVGFELPPETPIMSLGATLIALALVGAFILSFIAHAAAEACCASKR